MKSSKMMVAVDRNEFATAVAALAPAVGNGQFSPALATIKIRAQASELKLTATDANIFVQARVPAEVTEKGVVAVPGKKLHEIARALPQHVVYLSSTKSLKIVCNKSSFSLRGFPVKDFPDLPERSSDSWIVTGEDLHELIEYGAYATSTEESRPILSGVLWELKDEKMSMVSTSGHRLTRMQVEASGPEDQEIIVPRIGLAHVRRLFDLEEQVTVSHDANWLRFESGRFIVCVRRISGSYPNYRAVIPGDNDKFALADRDALLEVTSRVATMLKGQHIDRIKLDFVPGDGVGKLSLSTTIADLGEGADELDIEYEGERTAIGFNANYLIECLKNLPDGDVRIGFTAPTRAVTIEPVQSDRQLALVMPLRLMD